jgi:hypothetical protein
MKGTLIQLAIVGKVNQIIMGNPSINSFKNILFKNKNIAYTTENCIFKGSGNFGRTTTCTIPMYGDLLSKTYLRIVLPRLPVKTIPGDSDVVSKYFWVDSIGLAMIEQLDLIIGGKEIDSVNGEWLHLWSELSSKNIAKYNAFQNMVGNVEGLTIGQSSDSNIENSVDSYVLCIPLDFWFCRDIKYALPLIALQYHTVEIKLTIKSLDELILKYTPTPKHLINNQNAEEIRKNEITRIKPNELSLVIPDIMLWADYILLDNDERQIMTNSEYIIPIEQTKVISEAIVGKSQRIDLPFNGMVKELVWVLQKQYIIDRLEYFNYTDSTLYEQSFNPEYGNVIISNANISLNNESRIAERDAIYYNLVQPSEHHSWIPSTGIFCWSFVKNPENIEDVQGSCNFSPITKPTLNISIDQYYKINQKSNILAKIYTKIINYIKISNGQLGLVIST